MIYANGLFEVFSMGQMGKISLWGKWVNWIKLPQIYATLYLMTHSKDICEILGIIMRYNRAINVMFKSSRKIFREKFDNLGPS